MSIEMYHSLIDRICEKFDISDPGSMYQAAHLRLRGMDFTLYHGGVIIPDSVLMYCDFGELPTQSREQVLLRLLEANVYLFGANSPAFTYNPQKNHIMLMCRFSLIRATLESTLELFDHFAEMATRWNNDYFLFEDVRGIGAPL